MTPTATAVELKALSSLYQRRARNLTRPEGRAIQPRDRRSRGGDSALYGGRDLCRRGSRAKGFSRLEQDAGGAARQGALLSSAS